MKQIRVRWTFTEDVLGSLPENRDIYREFIASKAPDAESMEDEVARLGVDEMVEKGKTVFPHMPDGTPYIYDYQIKGFFKGAASAMRRITGAKSKKLSAHKKRIDLCVFVQDRRNIIDMHGLMMDECTRPLRAQTAQGERVSIACSEAIPEGSTVDFTIELLEEELEPYVREWLDYGRYNGFGQWRNSGKGRFVWDELDVDGNVIGGNNHFANAGKKVNGEADE